MELVLIALFNAWMQPRTDLAKIPKPSCSIGTLTALFSIFMRQHPSIYT